MPNSTSTYQKSRKLFNLNQENWQDTVTFLLLAFTYSAEVPVDH